MVTADPSTRSLSLPPHSNFSTLSVVLAVLPAGTLTGSVTGARVTWWWLVHLGLRGRGALRVGAALGLR